MAFQVENQSCPNREESFVSNNKGNNNNNNNTNINRKYNTTTANYNKNNILSNTIGIPSRGNTYQDPGADYELSTATSPRVDKARFGKFGNWECIEHDSDYNSESESEFETKHNSYNKRGSERTATSKETIVGQKKYASGALFTASASKKAFSEKEPIAVPRGDPELYQSKLFKYIELFLGNPYEENIIYYDGDSVNGCRSINDGYEWSSAPICYNS